jgi:hypothetical protein
MKTIALRIGALVMSALLCGDVLAQATDAAKPEVTLKRPAEFQFDGGNLADFVKAVKESFGIDLQQAGTVPYTMLYSVRVPKMRLTEGRVPGNNPDARAKLSFVKVLDLYNQVSRDGDPSMGRWFQRFTDDGEPSLIMLVPPQGTGASTFSVRAFSFPQKNSAQTKGLQTIQELIAIERDRLAQVIEQGQQPGLTLADIQGEVNNHASAGIIVAKGGRVFVEMASAIIQALIDQARNGDIEIPIPAKKDPEEGKK